MLCCTTSSRSIEVLLAGLLFFSFLAFDQSSFNRFPAPYPQNPQPTNPIGGDSVHVLGVTQPADAPRDRNPIEDPAPPPRAVAHFRASLDGLTTLLDVPSEINKYVPGIYIPGIRFLQQILHTSIIIVHRCDTHKQHNSHWARNTQRISSLRADGDTKLWLTRALEAFYTTRGALYFF